MVKRVWDLLMAPNAHSFRALVIRRKILQLVAENYIISASLISHTLLLSYATVLRHLRILSQQDLVELHKEGRTLVAKIKANNEQIRMLNSESYLFKTFWENVDMSKHETVSSNAKETKKG
jgi:DNA-binding transcriptional ArsR family regulator